MKKALYIIAIAINATTLHAQGIVTNSVPATISWDANTEADLAGYRIYVSNGAGDTRVVDVGNVTSHTLAADQLFGDEVNELRLTAYDTGGLESGFSNSVFFFYNLPPAAPENLNIRVELEASYDGGATWKALWVGSNATPAEEDSTIYRMRGKLADDGSSIEWQLVDLTEE